MCNAFEKIRSKAYEEGIEKGVEKGVEKGIRILVQAYQELGVPQEVIMAKCVEKYEITEESARKYVEACCV